MEDAGLGIKRPIGNSAAGPNVHRRPVYETGGQAIRQQNGAEIVAEELCRQPED